MTGNDVTYTYGTSGTATGRPVRITDGSGMYECQYDALGNVTEETRTIALPQLPEVYRFRTAYRYDSWGRMLSMTYPDGEKVDYTYQWGGDLNDMLGTKDGVRHKYISSILYNTFGQRSHVVYGNLTEAFYTYDALHRLTNLQSRNGSGTLMQDISYTFDSASNVTRIANSAGVVNSLGGGYANAYRYDALHRLVESYGGGAIGNYNTKLTYSPSGRLIEKYREDNSVTLSDSVEMAYGYCDDYRPHAVKRMFDYRNGMLYDLRWDEAGNLGQMSMAGPAEMFESGRFLFWTEDNRMHAAVDDRYYSYYAYDYGGERRLKLTGTNNVVDVNADHMSTHSVLDSPTLYPSAYMVVTSKGYTKHYYAGAERVAARIGGGWSDGPVPLAGNDDSLSARADLLYTQSLGQANGRVLEENEPGCVYGPLVESEGLNATIEEIPNHLQAVAEADCGTFLEAMHQLVEGGPGGPENDVYFYHSDHLGSASWITDSAGQAIQHLQYLPFGEPYVNQRTSNYSERFTFTGKERDEETGYGYFGARYMDYELMASFISVDRYADKYPFISPYAYCAWNPVKLVDQKGDSLDIAGGTIAQNDILSIVCPEYRTRISFNGNKVCVNVDGLTQEDIEKDAGFLTLYNMVNCKEKILYQAEDIINRKGEPIIIENNSKTPYSQYNKKGDPLPDGYDGQVILNPRAVFLGVINGEEVWSPNRASTVYHELEENYQRTVNGLPYVYVANIQTRVGYMPAEIPGRLGAHGIAQRNAFRLTKSARSEFGTEGVARDMRLRP